MEKIRVEIDPNIRDPMSEEMQTRRQNVINMICSTLDIIPDNYDMKKIDRARDITTRYLLSKHAPPTISANYFQWRIDLVMWHAIKHLYNYPYPEPEIYQEPISLQFKDAYEKFRGTSASCDLEGFQVPQVARGEQAAAQKPALKPELAGFESGFKKPNTTTMDSNWRGGTLPSKWPLSLDDWPVSTEDDAKMLGLNAVIVVLRHIYTIAPDHIQRSRNPEDHAVLRLARSPSTPRIIIDKDKDEAHKAISEELSSNVPSFLGWITSKELTRSIWSRKEFQLYSPLRISWVEEQSKWKEYDDMYSSESMAEHSLIAYDGETHIGQRISRLFGVFESKATGEKSLRLPAFPFALRVHYTPVDQTNASNFHRLFSFDLQAKVFGSDNRLRDHVEHYRLCAVVRSRPSPQDPDLVRLYTFRGEYVMPPDNGQDLVDDTWALGTYGFSYVLFYRKATNLPLITNYEEVVPKDPRIPLLRAVIDALPFSQFDATIPGYRKSEAKRPASSLTPAAIPVTGMPIPTYLSPTYPNLHSRRLQIPPSRPVITAPPVIAGSSSAQDGDTVMSGIFDLTPQGNSRSIVSTVEEGQDDKLPGFSAPSISRIREGIHPKLRSPTLTGSGEAQPPPSSENSEGSLPEQSTSNYNLSRGGYPDQEASETSFAPRTSRYPDNWMPIAGETQHHGNRPPPSAQTGHSSSAAKGSTEKPRR